MLVAACGSASKKAAATAAAKKTAPKKTTRYVSKRYGYSIDLPGTGDRWLDVLASQTWYGGSPSRVTPEFDRFSDLDTGMEYLIASQAQPAGTTLEDWTSLVAGIPPPVCRVLPGIANSTLGGEPAHVLRIPCSDAYTISVAAVHGKRGYVVIAISNALTARASDRRAFDAVLAGFHYAGGSS